MKRIFFLCLSLFLFSCKNEIKQVEEIKSDSIVEVAIDTVSASDNSQNSLDWEGTYKGIIPCADCEGIKTEITIKYDLTYVIKTIYLGKVDGKTFEKTGRFFWDKTGSNITLEELNGNPVQFKVGENQLIQLDLEGKIITGALAEKYVLKK